MPSRRLFPFPGRLLGPALGLALCASLAAPLGAAEAPEIEEPATAAPPSDTAKPAVVNAPVTPAADSARPSAAGVPAAPAADTSKAEVAAPADSARKAPPAEAAGPEIEAPGEPGPGEMVVEVDPGQSRNKDRSLPLAMLYSAVLPGAGELYLREKPDAAH